MDISDATAAMRPAMAYRLDRSPARYSVASSLRAQISVYRRQRAHSVSVLVSTEKPVDIGDLAFCPSLVDYVGDRGAGMRAWRTRPAMPEGSASCAGSPGLFLFAVLLRQMPFDVHGVVQDTADPDQLRADYAIKEEMAR